MSGSEKQVQKSGIIRKQFERVAFDIFALMASSVKEKKTNKIIKNKNRNFPKSKTTLFMAH